MEKAREIDASWVRRPHCRPALLARARRAISVTLPLAAAEKEKEGSAV